MLEKPKEQSNMDNPEKLATRGYIRHKTKTNKTKNTIQYVLDTTIHKTKTDTENQGMNSGVLGG